MSKDSNDAAVDALVAVGVLAVVAGVAWYLHTNYEFRWIWEAEFTDRYQSFDLGRTFTLMPKDSKGRSLNFDATLGRTQMGFSGTEQNRVTFGIRGTF
jgi:hypothetical protein